MSGNVVNWDNASVKIDISGDISSIFVTCQRCGKQHLVDEPEEQRREWLYCDTYEERVEFPDPIRDTLKRVAKSLIESSSGENKSEHFRLNVRVDGTTVSVGLSKSF